MNDLISRQAAIDALHMDTSIIPFKKAREYADATISEIRNRLEKLPSAQPKKGKWIDETFKPWGLVYHPYKCDQCGEHSEADSNFCPNCGTDMRQREEGET